MNKQEALKLVEQMGEYERFVDEPISKKSVLNIISQIEEPQQETTTKKEKNTNSPKPKSRKILSGLSSLRKRWRTYEK